MFYYFWFIITFFSILFASFLQFLEDLFSSTSTFIWNYPLLVLLIGGGLFLLIHSRFTPFIYFKHAINIMRGRYDDPNDRGYINHYQALSSALSSTIGMGNISGVALAIVTGGPGALFWMWISSLTGMAIKFYTCSLSIYFRGKDSMGNIQGGPMYVITEGLGKKWKPLAVMFCVCGLVGCLPIFQANQLTQAIRDIILIPNGIITERSLWTDVIIAIPIIIMVYIVILGGIKRIGNVAGKLVPFMVIVYSLSVLSIIFLNIEKVPEMFSLIFTDAFSGKAVLGGAVGTLIIVGIRRAAFSNEAGIGTAPIMHGAAKTEEPIREGLVAMLGPAIDTLIVCTMTALSILVTGVWKTTTADGVTLTSLAFEEALPFGKYILMFTVLIFSITSLFSFSYLGTKCMNFLVGAKREHYYNYFYIFTIFFGAVSSIKTIISLIDIAYALMSIPTMIGAILLAPKIRKKSKEYFQKLRANSFQKFRAGKPIN